MPTQQTLTAQSVYDELMQHIEPDLMTVNIDLLDQKYAEESKEEHMSRMAHYAAAFEIFDRSLADLDATMHNDVVRFKKKIRQRASVDGEKADREVIQSIEASIDDSNG